MWVALSDEENFKVLKGDEATTLASYNFGKNMLTHKVSHSEHSQSSLNPKVLPQLRYLRYGAPVESCCRPRRRYADQRTEGSFLPRSVERSYRPAPYRRASNSLLSSPPSPSKAPRWAMRTNRLPTFPSRDPQSTAPFFITELATAATSRSRRSTGAKSTRSPSATAPLVSG
jgi:hypothetical protein